MSNYAPALHKDYRDTFQRFSRLIRKEPISETPKDFENHRNKLVKLYNEYIDYISSYFESFEKENKDLAQKEILLQRKRLKLCFARLKIEKSLSDNIFEKFDATELLLEHEIEQSDESSDSNKIEENLEPIQIKQENPDLDPETVDKPDIPSNLDNVERNESILTEDISDNDSQNNSGNNSDNNSDKNNDRNSPNFMSDSEEENTMDQPAFLSFAAKQLNKTYGGDPLELTAFINSINLLKQIGPTHLVILGVYIKTKLTGKALESVPDDVVGVDEIVAALKANIKPDSSKVIEGKMMALKMDTSKTVEFTEQAEKLAEALQRSLIVEGITHAKAKSMAVDKTVEMCRQAAPSNDVRVMMGAAQATFTDPKEAIAKFVVESATDKKEKQIFKFTQQQNRGNRGNNRGNFRGNNRGNFRGNYRGNYRQNYNNSDNNWNGNGNNWRGGWRGKRGRGGRGRGQYFTVRLANSENMNVPSGDRRATNSNENVLTFQRVSN